MEFCIISPANGLERYATLSKTHLVLSHECERNKKYLAFYAARRIAGDFIILDNGSYELGHPSYNAEVINDLNPQVIVLPDYYLQPWKRTWHAAINSLNNHYEEFKNELGLPTEWLYIPQSTKGDLHGFLESYTEAASDPRISWIGIPRCLVTDITDNPLMRVEFARMVRKERPDLKLHAFGMVNGDVHEIPYLAAVGVNSIDSSAPVWRGWHAGKSIVDIADRGYWDDYGTPVDFNSPRTFYYNDKPYDADSNLNVHAKNDDVILANLEACGVRIPTGQSDSTQGQSMAGNPSGIDGSIPF